MVGILNHCCYSASTITLAHLQVVAVNKRRQEHFAITLNDTRTRTLWTAWAGPQTPSQFVYS